MRAARGPVDVLKGRTETKLDNRISGKCSILHALLTLIELQVVRDTR
jgi:hypothetical protein